MKVFVLLGIVATATALPALPEVGASTQYKTEDNFGNYAFGYNEDHTSGGSFRKEVGDSLGNKIGSYGLHDADGRARVVNYVADGTGFKADVHTNEPGVDPFQDPAHVSVNKPAVAVVAPPVIAHKAAVLAPAPAVVAPVIVHKTAPFVAVAPHHYATTLLHAPVYHAPFASAFVAHAPHVLW